MKLGAGLVSIAIAAAVGGCARRPITVAPREILAHTPELRRTGRAEVETEQGERYRLSTARRLRVALGGEGARELSVAELIAHCPEVPPFREDTYRREPPCLLLETRQESIPLGSRLRPDGGAWKLVAGALLATLVLGTAVGYVARCHEPDDGC